jgi:selenocysteine-specific elongation factor
LEILHKGDIGKLIEIFLDSSEEFAVSLGPIHQVLNVHADQARQAVEKIKTLRVLNAEGEKLYSTDAKWQKVKETMLGSLKTFHAGHPLAPGMDMEELRGKLPYRLSPKVFRVIVDALTGEHSIAKEENLLRLASHRVQLGGQEKTQMERIKQILGADPLAPPDLKEVEKQLGLSRVKLTEVLRLLEREGSVVRVSTDMYFLAGSIRRLEETLRNHLTEKGEMTAASFRDLIGSTRKYTIPLLEYFDRTGLTIRIGDVRRLKAPSEKAKVSR